MKKLLVVVVVLVVAVGALGYWRGWFTGGKVGSEKFKQDKAAFSKTVSEKTKALKDKVTGLWTKTERLKGDEKAEVEKELRELEKRHEQLTQRIKEVEDAGEDKFEDVKKDLTKNLEEVDKKIEELTKKLDKEKDK